MSLETGGGFREWGERWDLGLFDAIRREFGHNCGLETESEWIRSRTLFVIGYVDLKSKQNTKYSVHLKVHCSSLRSSNFCNAAMRFMFFSSMVRTRLTRGVIEHWLEFESIA